MDTILRAGPDGPSAQVSTKAGGLHGSREPSPRTPFGVKSLGLIGDSRCLYFKQKPPISGGF
jgi:hypothetical protein